VAFYFKYFSIIITSQKIKITQKDLAGDRFKRQYISIIETGEAELSYVARDYITKRLKLPKSYFDTGLFLDEKERLDELTHEVDKLTGAFKYDEALKKVNRYFQEEKEFRKLAHSMY